jgi:metallo-beta-lactamase class B
VRGGVGHAALFTPAQCKRELRPAGFAPTELRMAFVLAALLGAGASAETLARPVPPFHIAGNLFYVGHSDVTAFLFASPKGLILLDGGFASQRCEPSRSARCRQSRRLQSAARVEHNIEALGFRLRDVKILLNSHAHFDHAGALAELKKATGAKLLAPSAAARELASGGPDDGTPRFPPVQADGIVADGGTVELGGTVLTAHLTPGHTRGCTTWTTRIEGKDAVFVCSTSAPGYQLVGNPRYPDIVADYRKTFALLHALPCDYFFASHGSFFGLEQKRGDPRRFVDPKGYRAYLDQSEAAFDRQLAGQAQVFKAPEKR